MISEKYIRNAQIRAAAEAFAAKYPAYAGQVFTPQRVTFHGQDASGGFKVWTRSEVPHFALTSDISYWMAVDGVPAALWGQWWSICDILVAYLLRAATTKKTYATDAAGFDAAISAYGLDPSLVRSVLTSFSNHVSNIPYGSYLFNPGSVLPGAGSSGKGLALAIGASLLGLALVKKKG